MAKTAKKKTKKSAKKKKRTAKKRTAKRPGQIGRKRAGTKKAAARTAKRTPGKSTAGKKETTKKAAAKKAPARAKRPLHIVKIVHGAPRRELRRQWKRLYRWSELAPSPRKLRVYCEGVCVDGSLRDVTARFRRESGRPSLAGVIGRLLDRGARLEATEDPVLYRVAGALLRLGKAARELPDCRPAFHVSREIRTAFEKLNEERDRFVARRIDETLKKGEWAILYMGAEHLVETHVPAAIDVELLELLRWDG